MFQKWFISWALSSNIPEHSNNINQNKSAVICNIQQIGLRNWLIFHSVHEYVLKFGENEHVTQKCPVAGLIIVPEHSLRKKDQIIHSIFILFFTFILFTKFIKQMLQVNYLIEQVDTKCPICLLTVTTPLIQCQNGTHFICFDCLRKCSKLIISLNLLTPNVQSVCSM